VSGYERTLTKVDFLAVERMVWGQKKKILKEFKAIWKGMYTFFGTQYISIMKAWRFDERVGQAGAKSLYPNLGAATLPVSSPQAVQWNK
jgi:hypothetical protein